MTTREIIKIAKIGDTIVTDEETCKILYVEPPSYKGNMPILAEVSDDDGDDGWWFHSYEILKIIKDSNSFIGGELI